MRATRAAPVATVFASRASPMFPPARRSPMIPEPTTAASSRAVPRASATTRCDSVKRCVSMTVVASLVSRSTLRSGRRSRLSGRCKVDKQRVLFVCTHNSARSQMAEGFLHAMAGDRFEARSAGTERTRVHPLAIQVMGERGIDIGGHTSKDLTGVMEQRWDYLVTVCDDANERCPFVPGVAKRLHWSFADPSRAAGTDDDRLATFRRVRDEIETRIAAWLQPLASPTNSA